MNGKRILLLTLLTCSCGPNHQPTDFYGTHDPYQYFLKIAEEKAYDIVYTAGDDGDYKDYNIVIKKGDKELHNKLLSAYREYLGQVMMESGVRILPPGGGGGSPALVQPGSNPPRTGIEGKGTEPIGFVVNYRTQGLRKRTGNLRVSSSINADGHIEIRTSLTESPAPARGLRFLSRRGPATAPRPTRQATTGPEAESPPRPFNPPPIGGNPLVGEPETKQNPAGNQNE